MSERQKEHIKRMDEMKDVLREHCGNLNKPTYDLCDDLCRRSGE
jgi:hypothetical protein